MSAINKDVRKLLKLAEQLGCEVTATRRGHWMVRRDGKQITVSPGRSCPHALANARADMRRYLGVAV